MNSCDESHFNQAKNGIYIPRNAVNHRNDEYDDAGFQVLRAMLKRHFWYFGRHRFLAHILQQQLKGKPLDGLSMISLGEGVGGWMHVLKDRPGYERCELALGDSSLTALEYAEEFVGTRVKRFQIDLMDLSWNERWDVAFLLDVLEHLPDDVGAMRQIWNSLRPGGLLFVTTPALKCFWSYNDEMVHHLRRYSKRNYARLAADAGFDLRLSRYFMFYLSPLLYLSRLKSPDYQKMSEEERQAWIAKTHRVPSAPVNSLCKLIFGLETPLGAWMPFPWGTSILGVFQKRC